ncbi:hypothetical protein AB0M54_29650 [Actinoplanes sp. NPDC051470]|uniref:hypothetical protein n=1 Tax=Actinoplanes sp. NPDC051470 TaxID=3157224 RepID=UPI003427EFBA
MRRVISLLAGATLGLALLTGLPTAAQAQPVAGPSAPSGFTAQGDGYFYAWDAIDGADNPTTANCRWFNSDDNWENNCGNFRNRASSVKNNSANGNYANLYYHQWYGGAYACIAPGDYWNDLRVRYFSWGPADGKGKATNNEIAGFKWTSRQCGT